MRSGNAIEPADRAGDNRLATLYQVSLQVSSLQERQERHDAEIDPTHVYTKCLVKCGRINTPKILLQVGKRGGRGQGGGRGESRTRDTGVGDQQVDVTGFLGDVRNNAL